MLQDILILFLVYLVYNSYKNSPDNKIFLVILCGSILYLLLQRNKRIENFSDVWGWPKKGTETYKKAFEVCSSDQYQPCELSNVRRAVFWIASVKKQMKDVGAEKIKGIVFEPEGAGLWQIDAPIELLSRDEITAYSSIDDINQSRKDYNIPNLKIGITGGPGALPGKNAQEVEIHESFPQLYNLTKEIDGVVNIDTGINNLSFKTIPTPPKSIYNENVNNPQKLLQAFKRILNLNPEAVGNPGFNAMFTVESDRTGTTGVPTITGVNQGIVNGFGSKGANGESWTWDSFEQFLQLFADSYKVDNVAIFQFNSMPTTWIDKPRRRLKDNIKLGLWCEYPEGDLDKYFKNLETFINNKKIKKLVFRMQDPSHFNIYSYDPLVNKVFFNFLKVAPSDCEIYILPWVSQKSGDSGDNAACSSEGCHPWNPEKYQLTSEKALSFSDTFSMNEQNQLCSKPNGAGACHDQLAPYGMYLDKNGEFNKFDKCTEGCDGECKDGICITKENKDLENRVKNLPRPKIGLYHGGVVGAPLHDPEVYKKYLGDIIKFVQDKKIDVVYIVLSPPIMDKEPYQFSYYQNPEWIAKNFLEKLPRGVEAGVVCYIRDKDANWNFQNSEYATKEMREKMKGGFGENSCKVIDDKCNCEGLTLNNQKDGCPIRWNGENCEGSCPECPTCDDSCIDKCQDGNDTDSKKAKCFPKCPPGCPNMASQIMSYIGAVNKASNGSKIEYFSFDGEDAGSSAGLDQMCQLRHFANELAPDVKNIGYAMSMQLAPNVPAGNFSLPETYWFMNELWPCTGSTSQWSDPQNHPECTIYSSYRRFKDDPAGFLSFIEKSDQCGCSNGFESMKENIKNYKGPDGKSQIWPMFSIENLSMSEGANDCIARYWCNEYPSNHKICGTFDGFSYWSWDKFEDFLKIFANKYDVPMVNIYESQFIPPHWMPGNKYSPNSNEGPRITESCKWQNVTCTKDEDCTAYIAKDSENKCVTNKVISADGAYCKGANKPGDQQFCHFDIYGKNQSVPDSSSSQSKEECKKKWDCKEGEECVNGKCMPIGGSSSDNKKSCKTADDCPEGFDCTNQKCAPIMQDINCDDLSGLRCADDNICQEASTKCKAQYGYCKDNGYCHIKQ